MTSVCELILQAVARLIHAATFAGLAVGCEGGGVTLPVSVSCTQQRDESPSQTSVLELNL